jgi:hypothetical protein
MVRRLAAPSAAVLVALAGAVPAAQAQAPAPAPAQAQAQAQADLAPGPSPASGEGGAQQATPRSVSATATPDKVRLGEPFTLLVEIRDSSDVRYELPPDVSLGQEFDVVKVATSRTTKDEVTTTRFELQVLLFDLGDRTVGDLTLHAAGPKGPMTLTVPGPKLTGQGDLGDDDEQQGLHDILPAGRGAGPRLHRPVGRGGDAARHPRRAAPVAVAQGPPEADEARPAAARACRPTPARCRPSRRCRRRTCPPRAGPRSSTSGSRRSCATTWASASASWRWT